MLTTKSTIYEQITQLKTELKQFIQFYIYSSNNITDMSPSGTSEGKEGHGGMSYAGSGMNAGNKLVSSLDVMDIQHTSNVIKQHKLNKLEEEKLYHILNNRYIYRITHVYCIYKCINIHI
jgi:hypothetical protein